MSIPATALQPLVNTFCASLPLALSRDTPHHSPQELEVHGISISVLSKAFLLVPKLFRHEAAQAGKPMPGRKCESPNTSAVLCLCW